MAREVPPSPPGGRSLRRHPALVELSRDHHHALVQALALRRAGEDAGGEPTTVASAFLAFVEDDLAGHFADEEAVLLPRTRHAAPEESARVEREHGEIRALIGRLRSGDASRPLLHELGDLLHDHVRFEERALFERLQERLTSAELEGLQRAIDEHRQARGRAPGCGLDY